MKIKKFSGSTEITDEGIKKHFRNYEPIKALFELVWNGFDANATRVDVFVRRTELGGLDSISILDNGDGIDVANIDNNFKKFNESLKKLDDDKHGSHGKGRLAFHLLCQRATWYTRREGYDAKITINASSIKDYEGDYLERTNQNALLSNIGSGTCVELINFGNQNIPDEVHVIRLFSTEFGWYLALNRSRSIYINNSPITVPAHELHEEHINIENIIFNIKVIRWDDKPSSEKSYSYLINGDNKVIAKELSKFNNKVKFHSSAYVSSEWVDSYSPDDLEMSPEYNKNQFIYRQLMKELVGFQRKIYDEFLRRFVDMEMERFDANGYFPEYDGVEDGYAKWRKENTKAVIKEIYVADPSIFNKLNSKQAKILIRLIDKILVSNENNDLIDVLQSVVELDKDGLKKLSDQLNRTTLENIISTIEVLQKRQSAIYHLKEIMENRYKEILETPDLQKIIESNTWLFGPQYATLGAEENNFNVIARQLRDTVKDINIVSDSDIESGLTIDGVNRQVDLFLARRHPTFDSQNNEYFKCVVIEIKRPGVSLNKKHLQQLDDYAEIISKHPAFSSEHMRFDLVLIGRKISKDDFAIGQRLRNLKDRGEYGLVSDGKIKCYVKDWFSIFDEFELSNKYLLNNLNAKLGDLSKVETHKIVADLQV